METLIVIVFVLGYLGIAFEHVLKINKAAIALLTGIICWVLYVFTGSSETEVHHINNHLLEHFGRTSEILFFLLGAMTIVELIDAHQGFTAITDLIKTNNKKKLLWILSFMTFFLSAILDNLTTTIVMVSLLRKIIVDRNERLLFVGLVIIAANAGGAWSPIGDVTTTMLWNSGRITSGHIIPELIFPSLLCLLVPAFFVSRSVHGEFPIISTNHGDQTVNKKDRNIILIAGVSALAFVPVFKVITHLPPYMGVLFGLGVVWMISELLHKDKDDEEKDALSIIHALRKIDASSILFFLGILLAIATLETGGQLKALAGWMDHSIGNENVIVMSIGLLSALVDNVPLVAGAIGMYDLNTFPVDASFWSFLAYCAGTGGSILVIGSAAGVAAMGMEKLEFFWYLKKVGWLALLGYISGAIWFLVQSVLF